MLDASSLSLLCMTLKEFCFGGRDNPFGQTGRKILDTLAPRSPRHLRLPIIIAATTALMTCQRQGRGGIQRGRVTWSDLVTSGNLPRCVATRGKRFEVSFRKKAGGQLENFATLKQSPNRYITPTQITIVQSDDWLLGCGECNQLPTKNKTFTTAIIIFQQTLNASNFRHQLHADV